MIPWRTLGSGLLLLSCGCASLDLDLDPWESSTGSVSAYTRSRVADLLDAVPASVGWGWGIGGSFKATPLFHVGLGLTPVTDERVGFEDRVFRGHWREYRAQFPWTLLQGPLGILPARPWAANADRRFGDGVPLVYRWQILRDAPSGEGEYPGDREPSERQWGRHPPNGRESGGAFLIPEYRRALAWHDLRLEQGDDDPLITLGSPARATLWEASRDGPDRPQAWDLFEADVSLVLVGLRVGFRPVEALDFLLGIVGIDVLGDDIPPTTSNEPLDTDG